jgi:hypothetical protein
MSEWESVLRLLNVAEREVHAKEHADTTVGSIAIFSRRPSYASLDFYFFIETWNENRHNIEEDDLVDA